SRTIRLRLPRAPCRPAPNPSGQNARRGNSHPALPDRPLFGYPVYAARPRFFRRHPESFAPRAAPRIELPVRAECTARRLAWLDQTTLWRPAGTMPIPESTSGLSRGELPRAAHVPLEGPDPAGARCRSNPDTLHLSRPSRPAEKSDSELR